MWHRFFADRSVDAILAEHVWEHLTPEDASKAARTCYRFLRPSGRLRIAVPDGNNPAPEYIAAVRPGGSGPGAQDHQQLFTVHSLSRLLEEAGFDVTPLEWFDENGEFHSRAWDPMDGFVRRSLRFDERNVNGKSGYTSLIVDAIPRF
jgi:predicted SAM-dependent methyltransferase